MTDIGWLVLVVVLIGVIAAPPFKRYVGQRQNLRSVLAKPIEAHLGEVIQPEDPAPVRRLPLRKVPAPRKRRSFGRWN